MTMQEYKDDALSELQDLVSSEGLSMSGAEDAIFEIADSNTPIYHSDIMELGTEPEVYQHDTELETEGADVSKQVQTAIFEIITNHLYDWISETEECISCECILISSEEEDQELCENCYMSSLIDA